MARARPLSDRLLAQLPVSTRRTLAGHEELEATLARAMERLREAWPEISLSEEEFLPFLAERIAGEADPAQALELLRLEDLYLACACARGDVAAFEQFHARYFPRIETALRRLDPDGAFTDDIKQMVYLKVFVAPEGGEAKIVQFKGRGDLGKWVQVVAQRVAQNYLRGKSKERPLHESSLERLLPADANPELHYIKRLYRDDFNQAFREALATLTSKQRNVLRYRLVERMAVEELAALYHVHRMTITRWIAAIRDQLLRETQERLGARLEAGSGEVESIVRVLRSQIDASVRRFLERGDEV